MLSSAAESQPLLQLHGPTGASAIARILKPLSVNRGGEVDGLRYAGRWGRFWLSCWST